MVDNMRLSFRKHAMAICSSRHLLFGVSRVQCRVVAEFRCCSRLMVVAVSCGVYGAHALSDFPVAEHGIGIRSYLAMLRCQLDRLPTNLVVVNIAVRICELGVARSRAWRSCWYAA